MIISNLLLLSEKNIHIIVTLGNSIPQGIGFTPCQKCFNLPKALKYMLKTIYLWTISNKLYTVYFR